MGRLNQPVYILLCSGVLIFTAMLNPCGIMGTPVALEVPWNLHFVYNLRDAELTGNLANDAVPLDPALLGEQEAPEEFTVPPREPWVEYIRSQTAIIYYNATNPQVKRGEFGHAFTWDATRETWAPYAMTQGASGEYRVNVSSGSYVVSPQGVQLVDHTGVPQVRAAEWQVTRWDAQTETWTPLQFTIPQLTATRTAEALWVTRTWTGAPMRREFTETYWFEEGMKVTAQYRATEAGLYRVEWVLKGLPAIRAPADGTFSAVEVDHPQFIFDNTRVSWADAAAQLDRAEVTSHAAEKSLTLCFQAVPLAAGEVLEIDPEFGDFEIPDGKGDGWVNKEDWQFKYSYDYSYMTDEAFGDDGSRHTYLSFHIGDHLEDATAILEEVVQIYEDDEAGDYGNEDVELYYFQYNVEMGPYPYGDPKLDSINEIHHEGGNLEDHPAVFADNNHDWDDEEEYVNFTIPANRLGDYTEPGQTGYANYYLKAASMMEDGEWIRISTVEEDGTAKDPRLFLVWTEVRHDPSEDPCELYEEGFWVSCEGTQYFDTDGTNGWVGILYHDDAVGAFREGHSIEFEWILADPSAGHDVTIVVTNFIDPDPDHALGWEEWPSNNEFGVSERQPEDWEKGLTYYATFSIDPSTDETELDLEIELNWQEWWGDDPIAGCTLRDVPVGDSVHWEDANRANLGYEHDSWTEEGASSSMATPVESEIKDDGDFITVDLLSIEEMLVFQEKHNLNITGVELFNVETGETALVYLTQDESIEQGVQRLEDYIVKDLSDFEMVKAQDLSGFRVYAIQLDQTPPVVLEDSMVLSMGRIHPNNPEWEGNT